MSRRFAITAIFFLLIHFQVGAALQTTPTPSTEDYINYTVRSGDTLARIATQHQTTVEAIVRLNNLTNPELIVIGQVLRIPSSAGSGSPSPSLTISPSIRGTATQTPIIIELATEEAAIAATPELTLEAQSAAPTFDYGIEAFFDGENAAAVSAQIAGLGMSWVKIRVNWRDLEPTQGLIVYTTLDPLVESLRAANLKILLTVTAAPDWARSSLVENGPPNNPNDYATFIGALAARYAGQVQAYEIWNEPNLRREWNSTQVVSADNYAELLRGAYAAVKTADPNATVVSAGLAPTGFNDSFNAVDDRKFLSRMYELGLASMSDAIGAHPFGFANPPDSVCCDAPEGVMTHYGDRHFYFLDTLEDYHTLMDANGDGNKLIWVTQFGWGTSEGEGENGSNPPHNSRYVSYNSLEEQAAYIPRAFELSARLGYVGVMIAYNLNGCATDNLEACYYSLIDAEGQPRPVYNRLGMIFAAAQQ